jgi:hypothetical protein
MLTMTALRLMPLRRSRSTHVVIDRMEAPPGALPY